jgi:hypothetical protein
VRKRGARRGTALVALCLVAACTPVAERGSPGGEPAARAFVEVAAASGIDFRHVSGAAGAFLLPEIMGGGGGFLDYDGDGFLDMYLVQSGRLGQPDPALGNRLLRNDGRGSFVDVTARAGVGDAGYGMGCAAGDYDNDGDVDLYVTNVGPNVLYRNRGDGTFADATAEAGVGDAGWSTSAAFVDYDADGDLDLFVVNYVAWAEEPAFTEKRCFATTGARDYCSPQSYGASSFDTLYRNEGGGRFQDVSALAGLRSKRGTGLGVATADLDGDGRIDLYVSNDQMPSFAWINRGDGRFDERGVALGVAVDETGKSQAGMGVVAADVDDDGDLDLWKVHLYRESHVLYLNEGDYFDDVTTRRGLAAPTRPFTGFGTALFDYDLDGRLDAFVANGRVQYVPEPTEAEDPYAERNQLLRQGEDGRFTDVSDTLGPALRLVDNSRAAAFGDHDNDGDVDVLVVNRDGPTRLLRNDTLRLGGSLTLRIVERSGRDAHGARVSVRVGDRTRTFLVQPAYGYCATHDPRVHVGLGARDRVEHVDVRWVDGTESRYGPFASGACATLAR